MTKLTRDARAARERIMRDSPPVVAANYTHRCGHDSGKWLEAGKHLDHTLKLLGAAYIAYETADGMLTVHPGGTVKVITRDLSTQISKVSDIAREALHQPISRALFEAIVGVITAGGWDPVTEWTLYADGVTREKCQTALHTLWVATGDANVATELALMCMGLPHPHIVRLMRSVLAEI